MNFLLAWIIFSILFFVGIKPVWINNQIETEKEIKLIPTYSQALDSWLLIKNEGIVLYPVEWSIAEQEWINEGDIVIDINWEKITNSEQIIDIVWSNAWNEIELNIISHNATSPQSSVTSVKEEKTIIIEVPEEGKIGAYLWENIEFNRDFEYKYWFFSSIKYWFIETYNQCLLTLKWLKLVLGNIFIPDTPEQREETLKQVSWPIWIVSFMSTSITQWISFIIIIWAIISINLWVFNLLPIPALDWWRFFIIVINHLTKSILWKKTINETTEWIIHLVFLLF